MTLALYPRLMRHLGLFIDRCTSARSIDSLKSKMGMELPVGSEKITIRGVILDDSTIVMRTMHNYIGVIRGMSTMLSEITDELISIRKGARAEGARSRPTGSRSCRTASPAR